LKQSKRISVAVFVTCLILAVLITFMTTYTILTELFTANLRGSYLSQDGGSSIAGGNEKMSTIDQIYRSYYYNDLDDEKLLRRMAVGMARPVLSGAKRRAGEAELERIAKEKLSAISEHEKAGTPSVDLPAELFGELLGEIFASGLDGSDRRVCYEIGLHLGKFIYAADAAEDYDDDRRQGRYNPYVISYGGSDLTDENKQTIKCALLLEARKLEAAVNLVPFGNKVTVENIVRNIIYEGLPKRIEFLDSKEKDIWEGETQK
jgi:hypothetical protein